MSLPILGPQFDSEVEFFLMGSYFLH